MFQLALIWSLFTSQGCKPIIGKQLENLLQTLSIASVVWDEMFGKSIFLHCYLLIAEPPLQYHFQSS